MIRDVFRLILAVALGFWAITIVCTEGIISLLVPAILLTIVLIYLTRDFQSKHTVFSVAKELHDGLLNGSIVLDDADNNGPRERSA